MYRDIRDVEEYQELIRSSGDEWNKETAASFLNYWLLAVDEYTESDCDSNALEKRCGHLGAFGSGGDRLCQWFSANGKDPQLLWDGILSIEYQLDGDEIGGKAISQKFDRAGLLFRWVFNPDGQGNSNFTPTPTDEKILAVIGKYGHVKSQTDLLDKLSEDGVIMDSGTAKPRLALMKNIGVLVAWRGTRGYRRPE